MKNRILKISLLIIKVISICFFILFLVILALGINEEKKLKTPDYIEATPSVIPKNFTYIVPYDNAKYSQANGWQRMDDLGNIYSDFLIYSSAYDQSAAEKIFKMLDLENRQFCGETSLGFINNLNYYDNNKVAIHITFDNLYCISIYPHGTIITQRYYIKNEINDNYPIKLLDSFYLYRSNESTYNILLFSLENYTTKIIFQSDFYLIR